MRMKNNSRHCFCALVVTGAMLAVTAFAQDTKDGTVDHSTWNEIVDATVSEEGWVDYQAIKRKWSRKLRAYISSLGTIDVGKLDSKAEKMAFWINAYNAVTIQILLDEGLPDEVPHAAFFGKNIFKQEDYRVGGKVRSLDEIEHKILRKRYDEPRIHAALVCGASSCPRLRPEAYTGEKLDTQLTDEAEIWVRKGRNKKGRRKNRLDRDKGVYYVSEIFKWFNEDFYGGGKAGVLKFLKKSGDENTRTYLEKRDVDIKYLDYRWELNSRG